MTEGSTLADDPLGAAGEPLATPVDHEDHVDGAADARVTLVLYGDYECPYTRGTHDVVRKLLRRSAVGFRYVFRHFPLTGIHPRAVSAARAAEAAASEGRFWPMHDALLRHQEALGDEALLACAAEQGVSAGAMRDALEHEAHDGRIERDIESGRASGVRGTPVLFLQGRRYTGPRRSRELASAIGAATLAGNDLAVTR